MNKLTSPQPLRGANIGCADILSGAERGYRIIPLPLSYEKRDHRLISLPRSAPERGLGGEVSRGIL